MSLMPSSSAVVSGGSAAAAAFCLACSGFRAITLLLTEKGVLTAEEVSGD